MTNDEVDALRRRMSEAETAIAELVEALQNITRLNRQAMSFDPSIYVDADEYDAALARNDALVAKHGSVSAIERNSAHWPPF